MRKKEFIIQNSYMRRNNCSCNTIFIIQKSYSGRDRKETRRTEENLEVVYKESPEDDEQQGGESVLSSEVGDP